MKNINSIQYLKLYKKALDDSNTMLEFNENFFIYVLGTNYQEKLMLPYLEALCYSMKKK
ncbi:hypothetical protein ACQ27_gp526 [Klebsiella phage K64-1]|uniref:hypothetical protein n=1 Tax=Klebsiella phage K64-1 TaxID=1439894 RepID=UPI00248ACA68|nr:hypothetical protein ACQ27_gp526 [Klebsiella phage K64-1]